MNTLIVTVGLPRSGKSTWSIAHGAPIISGDAIRLAIHGTPFLQDSEDLVSVFGLYMIKSLFHAGNTVVIADDTYHTRALRQTRCRPEWETRYKVFSTTEEECIIRAINSGKPYLVPVIKGMAKELELLGSDELEYEGIK